MKEGVEMVGAGDVQFCRSCASMIDVPAALKHLPAAPEDEGARLGKFEIVREVGRGVTGVVFEARDPDLQRRVALKVLQTQGIGADPTRRFLREGRLLARIRHPNVVEIHELGSEGGKVFIAMEFVDGVPFPGTRDRSEALRRLAAVARALDHIHRQGVVHRDLKPTNILVDPGGRPVVMDFGIARSDDGSSSSATATGAVLGTPGYMAPEQLLGNVREVDARTDVYALGVLLYEILTGRLPIAASSPQDYAVRLKQGPPPGPRSIRPDVSRPLDRLCRSALSFRREDRPASAGQFADALLQARAPVSLDRRVVLPLAAALLGAAALAVGLIAWSTPSKPEPSASSTEEPKKKEPTSTAALVGEATNRKARALGANLSFDAAIIEFFASEALYRRAVDADPRNVPALAGLGRLYADLGRAGEAHREFDRALAVDPANLELLRAKGNLVVTAQLENLLDRRSFPKVSKALTDRVAEAQGRAFEELLKRLPPSGIAASLAAVYRAVARAEFDDAKRLLSQLPAAEESPMLEFAVQALIEQARPPAGVQVRGDEETPALRGETFVWIAIIRHLDRRMTRVRIAPPVPSTRTRVHGVFLRLEAAAWELRNDPGKAAEAFAHSVAAAPEYLQARLQYAKLLKEQGQKDGAARELDAAERCAAAMGLGPAAQQEIRSLP
jgi:serine/threonine-protein kinase